MRIGLNLLPARPEIRGGWTYIESLLAALGTHDRANEYLVFVNEDSESLVPARPNFRAVRVGLRGAARIRRVLYENAILPFRARAARLDCLHWLGNTMPPVNSVPGVVTIFDLLVYHEPRAFSPIKRRYLRSMIASGVRRAAVLLPMSMSTARDLRETLHVDPTRMVVIPPLLDARFAPAAPEDVSAFRARRGLPERFWLYVAHFYPHKNHLRLLRAYAELKRAEAASWPLVLRGEALAGEPALDEAVAREGLRGDVLFLPGLEKDEMPFLYSAASALVYPSLFEGAGLPVAEAMACGCPVAGSSLAVIRDAAGEAALYFDPAETSSIAAAMARLQRDDALRRTLRERGLAQAGSCRADRVIETLVASYARAARGPGETSWENRRNRG